MPISNLVDCAVNLAENVTGVDIDRDGDIGVCSAFHGCNSASRLSHAHHAHAATYAHITAPTAGTTVS